MTQNFSVTVLTDDFFITENMQNEEIVFETT